MDNEKNDHFGSPSYGEWNDKQVQKKRVLEGEVPGKTTDFQRRVDSLVYEDVWEALYHNPEVDVSEIEVSVKEGTVALKGFVDSRGSKRLAESTVRTIAGVLEVDNQLWIRKPIGLGVMSPEEENKDLEPKNKDGLFTGKGF